MTENKKELRKRILSERDSLNPEERAVYDADIRDKVLTLIADRQIECVLTYVSFRSEVDTCALIDEMLSEGLRIAVPRVEDKEIGFYYISSVEDLVSGYMGIREPSQLCKPWKPGDPDTSMEKTMILVPGSVFDLKFNRIGYGGGYYDRFLAAHSGLIAAGLGYECQVVDEIMTEPWDRPLDLLITPKRYIGNLSC